MNLTDLKHEVEDKAVEHLSDARLDDLEQSALRRLNKGTNYVHIHKLEFSALINAVRGLRRKHGRCGSLEGEINK